MNSHELFHQSRICIDTIHFNRIRDRLIESFQEKLDAGHRSPYHIDKIKPGDFLIQYPCYDNRVHYHFDDNPAVIRRRHNHIKRKMPANSQNDVEFVSSAFAVRVCPNGKVPTFGTYLRFMHELDLLDMRQSTYPFYDTPDYHDDMVFIATPEELMLLTAKNPLPLPPNRFL